MPLNPLPRDAVIEEVLLRFKQEKYEFSLVRFHGYLVAQGHNEYTLGKLQRYFRDKKEWINGTEHK